MPPSDALPTSDDVPPPTHLVPLPLSKSIRALGFWLGVLLPLVHVPLFVRGLSTPEETLAFATLLLANVCAFRIGHGYGDRAEPARTDD